VRERKRWRGNERGGEERPTWATSHSQLGRVVLCMCVYNSLTLLVISYVIAVYYSSRPRYRRRATSATRKNHHSVFARSPYTGPHTTVFAW
jgi:hypothetical protein